MRIKVILLLCFLCINGCSIIGKSNKIYLGANNKEYTTNCSNAFGLMSILYVVPIAIVELNKCNAIYLGQDKFFILHNGKLYLPMQFRNDYVIKIDVNKLKKDKTAKVVYEDNRIEPLKFYEEGTTGYGAYTLVNLKYSRAIKSKKFSTSK